jgi:bifunctional DNA-binding transcriptional regulator/antitoxin component of YhaV-PrlF toxin-antitoxin module
MPGRSSDEERVHKTLEAYARGEIDELSVAEELHLDTSTEKTQMSAIQSVRNMMLSGASPTLDTKKAYTMGDRASTFHGVTTLHGEGRTQVPRRIRDALGLRDGDYVFWYEVDGMIVLSPHEMSTDWMRGNVTYMATKPQASRPRQKF